MIFGIYAPIFHGNKNGLFSKNLDVMLAAEKEIAKLFSHNNIL
jgi:cobyrinic acid a,c-diamide synthase